MPILPYAREAPIQRGRGKLHITLWGAQPVLCQPLPFMEQAITWYILLTESRLCDSGCRRIILLRITPTMRALIVQRAPQTDRWQVVTPIPCTHGTTTTETRYRNIGWSTVWDMAGQEGVAAAPILILRAQVQPRQSITFLWVIRLDRLNYFQSPPAYAFLARN